MRFVGKGLIVEPEFPEYGDVKIDWPLTGPILGQIKWFDFAPGLFAWLTSSPVADGTVARAEAEPHQVPMDAPYEVELAEGAFVPRSEVVVGDDNWRLRRVDGAPGPEEYAVDGRVLTLNAARAGLYIYADYFYSDPAAGKTVVVNPFGKPAPFKLLAVLNLYDNDGDLNENQFVLCAERCQRISPLADNARGAVPGSFGFAFEIENRSPGDVVLHFPP